MVDDRAVEALLKEAKQDPFAAVQALETYRQIQRDEAAMRQRTARRGFFGCVLVGLAVVAVILSIVLAIYFDSRASERERIKIEQERTKRIEQCVKIEHPAERQLCLQEVGSAGGEL